MASVAPVAPAQRPVRSASSTHPRRQWLTPAEAALYLNVAALTLYRWRREGTGPAFCQPAPRIVRYAIDELHRWLGREGGI